MVCPSRRVCQLCCEVEGDVGARDEFLRSREKLHGSMPAEHVSPAGMTNEAIHSVVGLDVGNQDGRSLVPSLAMKISRQQPPRSMILVNSERQESIDSMDYGNLVWCRCILVYLCI